MATSTTVSFPLPSSRRRLRWRGERIQRLLARDRTLGYLFLFPAILVIVGLVAYPFASAIVMTFQAKTAGTPGRFIGLDNYRELLQSEQFLRTVVNTVVYTAVGVGVKFFLGLSMALVLNQERFCNNLFRSFLLIPWAIPAVMLSAILTSAGIQFVLILTNGGPADRTMIFPVLAYNLALGGAQRLGMGAAVSLIFFPILVVFIVFLTRRMLREKGE